MTTEHSPRQPRTDGRFALLCGLLGIGGTRAPKTIHAGRASFLNRELTNKDSAVRRTRVLLSLAAIAAFFAFTGTALAAAPEPPEIGVRALTPTEITVAGFVNPKVPSSSFPVDAGTYEFVYRPSTEAEDKCQGSGEQVAPAAPGMYLGLAPEEQFPETITGLTPGTGYAVCMTVEDTASETAVSAPVFRITPVHPETPESLEAKPVDSTTATLIGTLNPKAVGDPGSFEFLYKQSPSECTGGSSTGEQESFGAKGETVKAELTGLLPNTTYTFCVHARNDAGEEAALSTPVTFTTPAAAPSFSGVSVVEVASSSATLQGEVNPGGVPSSYVFEYAPKGGTFTPVSEAQGTGTLPAGGVPVALSVHIQHGLSASSAYEFRLAATNSVETRTSEPVWFRTQGAGSFALADGRGWELVSPADKHGALLETLGGYGSGAAHLSASSPAGGAFTYAAGSPTEPEPSGYSASVQVLSTRGPAGWVSTDLPAEHANQQTAYAGTKEYPLFSEDLSHAALNPLGGFAPSLSPAASEQTPYLRTNFPSASINDRCTEGCYQPLVTGCPKLPSPCPQPIEEHANVPPGTTFGLASNGNGKACPPESSCGPALVGSTPDLSHVVLKSNTPFEPGVPGEALYEWSAATGHLLPISVLPNGETSGGDVFLGGALGTEARHAISTDGSLVLFTVETGGPKSTRLYLRDMLRGETVELGGEGAFFQVASSDGSKIFYTTGQQAGDLYEFEVTSGPNEPLAGRETPLTSGANVQDNVIGASEDGSYVYFVANAQLAPGAVAGTCSTSRLLEQQGQCNLYEWHEGRITLVAVLGANDWPDWTGEGITLGGLASLSARVSPDGQWLAFMSQRPLTGYNSDDAKTGRPDEEVFLYDTARAGLVCASCDPTGARPVGVEWKDMIPGIDGQEPGWNRPEGLGFAPQGLAGSVPGWQTPFNGLKATYQSRYLSDNGRLFFNASDALVPADINGVTDVYEYEPQGVPEGEHACSSASTSGSDVFKPERTVKVEVGTPQEHAVTEGAGCVALISSGTSPEESAFLDASAGGGEGEHGQPGSEGGADVFFLTAEKLAKQDSDQSYDVYDAHECTTAAPCLPQATEAPPPCKSAEECRAAETPQPQGFGPPASATFTGPGNPAPPPVVKPKPKVVKCKRGFVKSKKGRCVKKPKKKKNKAKKSAHTNRRTGR